VKIKEHHYKNLLWSFNENLFLQRVSITTSMTKFVLFSLALLIIACGNTSADNQAQTSTSSQPAAPTTTQPTAPAQVVQTGNAPLLGTYWKVIELNGKDMANKTAKEMYFLLDPTSPQFKSHSGCNMVMGEAKRTGDTNLQFTNLLNTSSDCKTPDIDAEFLKAVESVTQYTLEGNTLLLKKNASTVLFKCTTKAN
jgi:heat shock protein HslJ